MNLSPQTQAEGAIIILFAGINSSVAFHLKALLLRVELFSLQPTASVSCLDERTKSLKKFPLSMHYIKGALAPYLQVCL